MKQTKNKYLGLLLVIGLAFSLQSCLKNGNFYQDFSKGGPAVELPLAAQHVNKPIAVSFDVSNTPIDYYVVVNVASVDVPASPVTATIAVDAAYLDQYNADQDAAAKKAQADYLAADSTHTVNDSNYPADYEPYELMPDSTYQISTLDVNIPAGHREDSIPMQIFTNKIAPGHNYLLPVSITKSSVNISNWSHLMLNIGAKNQFDGKYSVDGTMIDVTNAAFTGYYPKEVSLVTQGLSTDAYFDKALGGFGYVFDAGGGLSYFGNWDPVFTFDADGNVTSVNNYYDDPAPRSRKAQLDTSPGAVNKFDLATKSMDVNYYMIQAGNVRLKIHEIWTYEGPR